MHKLIELVLFHVAMVFSAILIAYLIQEAKKPPKNDPFGGEKVLFYGWHFKGMGWFLLLGTVSVAVICMFFIKPPQPGSVAGIATLIAICVVVSILAIVVIVECTFVIIMVDFHSITGHSPWRLVRKMEWGEVAEVSYSRPMQWFVVSDVRGEKIRVPVLLSGISEFVSLVRLQLPPDRYERAKPGFDYLGM